jgi:hypothetical protein
MTGAAAPDPEYVAARGVLLDALDALGTQRKAVGQARGLLEDLFGNRDAVGAQMAVRASVGLEDEIAIAISCEALARRLLAAWK